jgi:lysyl-tRNA synthetase, class II
MHPSTPAYEAHDEFKLRNQKLAEIRELGMEPYPHQFQVMHCAAALHKEYGQKQIGHSEDAEAGKTPFAKIAGRQVLFRSMGKNAFGHIQDATGRIQVMFNKEHTKVCGFDERASAQASLTPMKFIEKKLDLGDILGLEGHLFHTNKGELTLYVQQVTLLCKTLLPLADKHSGLADKELRYRKRWLDLITHPDVAEKFRVRSALIKMIREYFYQHAFLEVETPVLQSIYGGAEARPFVTKLHALEQEMFMRISLEIPLKKLIVGGMDRIFEIGRVFRNEGIDRNHNPEFTLLEAYAAYWDYNDMMRFVENLFESLALKLYGTTKIAICSPEQPENSVEIDLKAPWVRMSMKESLLKYAQLDVENLGEEQMRRVLKESGHLEEKKLGELSRGLLIAALFEVYVEPHLIQPHHITDHPIETTPLCKPHRNPKERAEGLVERFESFILSQEICNSYTELNDPEIQRRLLMQQAERREVGDEQASPFDEEFIEAICQGMPPTGGIGIGIDRLIMILTNTHSIRDVLFFPWMKPLSHSGKGQ